MLILRNNILLLIFSLSPCGYLLQSVSILNEANPMKVKIIVNPTAGKGAALQAVPETESLLKNLKVDFDIVYTERPWHAVELARKAAADGFDVVAAMGGDGTVNEVINGLMISAGEDPSKAALAVLTVGRGNDFAFGAGLPIDLEKDCQILAEGKRRQIDVGRVFVDGASEGRYFGNGIGIGFDAVVGFVAVKQKRLQGFLGYLVAALKTLFLYFKAPTVQMRFNDEEKGQAALMISIMNGQRMGGGFMMAPDGIMNDGQLDLCIAGAPGKMQTLALMLKFMNGSQAQSPFIRTDRTRKISIEALEGVLPAHADGETLCEEGKRLDVEILPGRLEIIG